MKKICIFILLFFSALSLYAQKIEKIDDINIKVTGDRYIATFNDYNGGYMQSLIVDGEEFEETSIESTRGSFLCTATNKVAKIEKRQWNGNKYTLMTDLGNISYEFFPNKIEISAIGDVPQIGCFFVLNPTIRNAKVDNEFIKVPINKIYCNKYIWINNKAAIMTEGEITGWGPWQNTEAINFPLDSKVARKIIITPYTLTDEEIEKVKDSPEKKDFILYSPQNYQVFQRYSKNKGKILISGRISNNIKSLSYRITGKDLNNKPVDTKWVKVTPDEYNIFNVSLDFNAGGWYKLYFKYKVNNEEKTYTIDKVGIGEIIIGAGQSNSTNCAQERTKQESGMVASTDGINWQYGDDPQIGIHDGLDWGSLYPSLGDALYKEFNVPIGVSPSGCGATTIAQWQPEANYFSGCQIKTHINLYDFFMRRVYQFGKNGFRCVLWHQGEGDFFASSEYYYDSLSKIIWQSRKDAGWFIPWFTAKATYMGEVGISEKVRKAQEDMWINKVSFEGPDTDQWLNEYRDNDGKGVHFNPKGLKVHGEAWAKFIAKYIHSQID